VSAADVRSGSVRFGSVIRRSSSGGRLSTPRIIGHSPRSVN